MTTIAFIGLGNMGAPMAINLAKAGHDVHAFDLSREAIAKVVAEGGTAAVSAQDAVEGAKVVITMLPASPHVEALFLGKDGAPGLLAHIAPARWSLTAPPLPLPAARRWPRRPMQQVLTSWMHPSPVALAGPLLAH